MKTHYFYDECWRANIWLVWNVSGKELSAWTKKQFGLDYPIQPNFHGKCLEILDKDDVAQSNVIVLSKWEATPLWISVLAHEALHAVDHVLSDRGIKLTRESHEAYTYFHEAIMRRCLNALMPSKKKRK